MARRLRTRLSNPSGASLEPGFARYRCPARARQILADIVGIGTIRTARPSRYCATGCNYTCSVSVGPRFEVNVHRIGDAVDALDRDLNGAGGIGPDLLHVLGRANAGRDSSTGFAAPQPGAGQSGSRL